MYHLWPMLRILTVKDICMVDIRKYLIEVLGLDEL